MEDNVNRLDDNRPDRSDNRPDGPDRPDNRPNDNDDNDDSDDNNDNDNSMFLNNLNTNPNNIHNNVEYNARLIANQNGVIKKLEKELIYRKNLTKDIIDQAKEAINENNIL